MGSSASQVTCRNYISGEWCESQGGEVFESLNPSTGALICRAQRSTAADAHEAAVAAKEAFDSQDWAFNPELRSRVLLKWASRLDDDQEQLAQLLCAEVGKTIREARYEVGRAISYLTFYAGVARSLYGSSTALSRSSYSVLAREPVGTVAVIVPWNYPVTLLMRSLAPALAAGNSCVIKPASYTPSITSAWLSRLADLGELPRGIVEMVTGPGAEVGAALVDDPYIDMVSFTGDSVTGKAIMAQAAATVKKVALELGGKSPQLVFADADLEHAIPSLVSGIFSNAGQLCTVGSRVLVHADVRSAVIEGIKRRTEQLVVGPSDHETSDMGPVASEAQFSRVMRYVELGKQSAQLVTGGHRLSGDPFDRGCFVAPTVFADIDQASPVVQDEIFGPVLTVQTFQQEDEALALANGTPYGLAAGLWTSDVSRALRVSRRLRAGTVWVNAYNRLAPEVETGGYKESGIGRASGIEGIREYTEVKHLYLDFTSESKA